MLPRDTADQISAAGTFCTLYSPYVVPIYVVALFGNSWFLSPSRSICFTVYEVRKESIRMNSWIRPKAIAMIFKYVRPRFLHSFKKIQKRCELCSIANSARLWQQGITPTGTEGNGKTSVKLNLATCQTDLSCIFTCKSRTIIRFLSCFSYGCASFVFSLAWRRSEMCGSPF